MRRLRFILAVVLVCAACARAPRTDRHPRPPATEDARRPNFVVVLTDDLRYDYLSSAGHPFVETPSLDQLAREGTTFSNSFVVTPRCCPSRATLLSGLSTHRSGVSVNGGDLDYDTVRTLPALMQQSGYTTAFFGKYHLGLHGLKRPGFDRWVASSGKLGHGEHFDDLVIDEEAERETHGYNTDVITGEAVSWIEERGSEPFIVFLFLKSPHHPLKAAPRHDGLYASAPIELPRSFNDERELLPSVIREEFPAIDRLLRKEQFEEEKARKVIRKYSRMIPAIDENVGRLYSALAEKGLLDQTVLLFTSDNGRLLGEHGLFGKDTPYEPSIRVPLILRWPAGVAADRRSRLPVLNLDLAPTILDLARAEIPEEMTGRSLVPILRDDEAPWREDVLLMGPFLQKRAPYLALRTPRWKYTRYVLGELEEQLFDIEKDPDERVNLAAEPGYEQALVDLRARLKRQMEEQRIPEDWWDAIPSTTVR